MLKVIVLATLTAAVAQGTPLLLTALGEILTQRSGVLNLGLEGMMLMGAASAFIALIHTDSLLIAVLAGALCSGLLALLHAFLSVTCRVHQIICGLALNIFAGGLSGYLGKDYNGIAAPKVLPNFRIPLLADIPYVGEIFFNQNLLVYLSYGLVIGLTFMIFHTQTGLKLRACGENPAAAYSMGIDVNRTRYIYVVIGGMLAGIGGSFLILSTIPSWVDCTCYCDMCHVEAKCSYGCSICFRRSGSTGVSAPGNQCECIASSVKNASICGNSCCAGCGFCSK